MLKRILTVLIAFPAAAALITLAVANRHAVTLVLDPFNPSSPLVSLSLPFYVYLLGALTLGVVLGGISAWMAQAHWRRRARHLSAEARRWQSEADRLARERDASIAGRGRDLPAPDTERNAA
ncbi:MAG: LapA family protein [Deltaproteobacteria bacterium]